MKAKYKSSIWSDEMLLELVTVNDDRIAFAELYDRYWQLLINMAGKRIPSIQVAEEIVQDVFVDFYSRRKDIRIENSLGAYLKTATKYQIYKTYRTQQVHEAYVNTIIAAGHTRSDTSEDLLEAKQFREEIDQVTGNMSETCRQVFLLSRFEEFSNQDIAQKLNISVAMVRKHITKAMNMMRSRFGEKPIDLLNIILVLALGFFVNYISDFKLDI